MTIRLIVYFTNFPVMIALPHHEAKKERQERKYPHHLHEQV